MKLEFNGQEIEVMLKKVVAEQFPKHTINHFNMTTYGHLVVDLELKVDRTWEPIQPPYTGPYTGDLNDE